MNRHRQRLQDFDALEKSCHEQLLCAFTGRFESDGGQQRSTFHCRPWGSVVDVTLDSRAADFSTAEANAAVDGVVSDDETAGLAVRTVFQAARPVKLAGWCSTSAWETVRFLSDKTLRASFLIPQPGKTRSIAVVLLTAVSSRWYRENLELLLVCRMEGHMAATRNGLSELQFGYRSERLKPTKRNNNNEKNTFRRFLYYFKFVILEAYINRLMVSYIFRE